MIDLVKENLIPLAICILLLFINFIVSSVFGEKLRSLSGVSILLLVLFSISWSGLVVVGSILLFEQSCEMAVIASIM